MRSAKSLVFQRKLQHHTVTLPKLLRHLQVSPLGQPSFGVERRLAFFYSQENTLEYKYVGMGRKRVIARDEIKARRCRDYRQGLSSEL